MDYLTQYLKQLIDNPSLFPWVLAALVALAFFVVALAVSFMVTAAMDPVRQRLRNVMGNAQATSSSDHDDALARRLKRLRHIILPRDTKEVSRVRLRLLQGGHRSPNALLYFFSLKALGTIVFLICVLLVAPFFPAVNFQSVIYAAAIAAGIGLLLPNYILDKQIKNRQEMIRKGFPDALDLLVVCVEAGLAFDVAVQRVAEDLGNAHAVLAEELRVVGAEVRAGVDRIKALRNFADRTGLQEIGGFVALMAQSVRFGTSVAETLRIYSEDFRDRRVQAAEEKAAKIGTKLIFPLVFCYFPSFFVVAIGPLLLRLFRVFNM